MTYRVPKTKNDLLILKKQGEPEGPFLEYKSARLFNENKDKVFAKLSNELTAFANSAGGVLIIGLEENSARCIKAIEPITDDSITDSWIEDCLSTRISPPMTMEIHNIDVAQGRLIVINVPPSSSAPHQASDKRYYARRLYRIDPLLAFEIDDIRRRAKKSPLSVNLEVWFENGIINFLIENAGIHPIYDVKVAISGISGEEISKAWTPNINRPFVEPFRIIHQDEKMSFLGVSFDFFKQKSMDEVTISVTYSDSTGLAHKKEKEVYIEDYETAQTQKSNAERSLEEICDHLSGIKSSMQELSRTSKSVSENAIHASGINLSKTTLEALSSNLDWKWSGEYLSHMALAEVLEIDLNTADKVWSSLFGKYHLLGGESVDLEQLDVDEDVKEKIRKRLIIKSDQ